MPQAQEPPCAAQVRSTVLDPDNGQGNPYVYTCIQQGMSEPRLYWRVKVNGKWTWRPAVCDHQRWVHGMRRDDDENSEPIGMQVIVWLPTEHEVDE